MRVDSPRLRQNNFDLIRLLLAIAVCLLHAYELSARDELSIIDKLLSGKIAIESFFVISGFLIFMSYEKSRSLVDYFEKRGRRIYPAYFVSVALAAVLLCGLSELSVASYFRSDEFFRYLVFNLGFLNFIQPDLPGVFAENRISSVNGALWTIKIEVMFYLSVPAIAWLSRRAGYARVMLMLFVASTLYSMAMSHLHESTGRGVYELLEKQLPGQLRFFIAGALLYYFLPYYERHLKWLVLASGMYFLLPVTSGAEALKPLALGVLVIFFALYNYLGNFGKFGDFSYGVYILHFPIVQTLVHLGFFDADPWLALALTVSLTLLGAVLMWHCVERRWLLKNSHYVRAQDGMAQLADKTNA
ncbi:acyltransferase family protein [Pseudomonas subflava]|uniref:acyltransferase family protein n=1 Tax=Pseudomonas subflava TaxID=2952933 RepID=UPI00207ADDED|nr:acyltransferase [Pseudomonas subflava]